MKTSKIYPEFKVGDKIRIFYFLESIKSLNKKIKKRTQIYAGIIISKHKEKNKTLFLLVRKVFQNGAIEKMFSINSP